MRHPSGREGSDPLISVREAARRLGLNKSTLGRQIRDGSIRSVEGKVRFSEVLEDRANNIDLSRATGNPKGGKGAGASTRDAPADAPFDAPPDDEDADLADTIVMVDGQALPFPIAKALKETYLARLRRLEFEAKSGALVDRALARKLFFDTARENRDAWTNWPARISLELAAELSVDARILNQSLDRLVHQHLAEMGEPEADL